MLISLSAGVPLKRRGFRSLVSIPPAISSIVANISHNIAINKHTELNQFKFLNPNTVSFAITQLEGYVLKWALNVILKVSTFEINSTQVMNVFELELANVDVLV